jgi:5'-3' exonuclease
MIALIDSDALVFRMSVVVEDKHPFTGEILGADPEEAWALIELRTQEVVDTLFEEFDEEIEVVHCFSSPKNYRKDVEPSYKSNRTGEKPILYKEMVEKTKRNYEWHELHGVEADDIMGIFQCEWDEQTVIVSPDKDMKQIQGYHLNLNKLEEGVSWVTEEEGHKFFLTQCIAGDPTDGYAGCPAMGMTKATKWLEKYGYTWDSVVLAYEKAMSPKSRTETSEGGKKTIKKLTSCNYGLGEEDALKTARMAFILNSYDYYDLDKQEVNLWTP